MKKVITLAAVWAALTLTALAQTPVKSKAHVNSNAKNSTMAASKSTTPTKSNLKSTANATSKPTTPVKTTPVKTTATGKPDMRYKTNQHLKKDGTPDLRYKANKKQ